MNDPVNYVDLWGLCGSESDGENRIAIIGWDDSKEAWLVLNSWGNTWSGYDGFVSNGDGTTWIKYSDTRFDLFSVGYAIELVSE